MASKYDRWETGFGDALYASIKGLSGHSRMIKGTDSKLFLEKAL